MIVGHKKLQAVHNQIALSQMMPLDWMLWEANELQIAFDQTIRLYGN